MALGQGVNLDELVDQVCQHAKFMTPSQIQRIQAVFGRVDPDDTGFNAHFDLMNEVTKQIEAVGIMRNSAFANGMMLVDAREAQAALQSSLNMIKVLTELQGELLTQARHRTVETCTVDVMKELGPEVYAKFKDLMTERLGSAK